MKANIQVLFYALTMKDKEMEWINKMEDGQTLTINIMVLVRDFYNL